MRQGSTSAYPGEVTGNVAQLSEVISDDDMIRLNRAGREMAEAVQAAMECLGADVDLSSCYKLLPGVYDLPTKQDGFVGLRRRLKERPQSGRGPISCLFFVHTCQHKMCLKTNKQTQSTVGEDARTIFK